MSNLIRPSGDMINVSINPTYKCNMRCEWCYLTPDQLQSRVTADIDTIKSRLDEIAATGRTFSSFDIYGGEVSFLPPVYQKTLLDLLSEYNPENINVISNLTRVQGSFLLDQRTTLGVSYDFEFRNNHERVWYNMLHVGKSIHVIILAIPQLVAQMREEGVSRFIECLNSNPAVASVEIKPYSTNQANQLVSPATDFEWMVKEWLTHGPAMDFEFINAHALDYAVNDKFNAYSDDHVYITPTGRFAVLEFDDEDREFFLELDSFDAYLQWTDVEKQRVDANKYCGACKYKGKCLSEHLREPTSLESSCNGFKSLIEWYEQW